MRQWEHKTTQRRGAKLIAHLNFKTSCRCVETNEVLRSSHFSSTNLCAFGRRPCTCQAASPREHPKDILDWLSPIWRSLCCTSLFLSECFSGFSEMSRPRPQVGAKRDPTQNLGPAQAPVKGQPVLWHSQNQQARQPTGEPATDPASQRSSQPPKTQ